MELEDNKLTHVIFEAELAIPAEEVCQGQNPLGLVGVDKIIRIVLLS